MDDVATGPGWELRLGRWQDVLPSAETLGVGAVITDPPYDERTHSGQRYGRHFKNEKWVTSKGISYGHIGGDDVSEISSNMRALDGWSVYLTSHRLAKNYESSLEKNGNYVFAPLPVVMCGMNIRLAGDGPSSWCVWCVVSRPRTGRCVRWGTLPGAYVGNPFDHGENTRTALRNSASGGFPGMKPLWLMRALVRDYSRPGDLVCDPYAGSGTTLLAAVIEGRRAIGAEMDRGRFDMAVRRLREGHTPNMFGA